MYNILYFIYLKFISSKYRDIIYFSVNYFSEVILKLVSGSARHNHVEVLS